MWHALIRCAKIVIALSLNIEQTHIEWNVNSTESFLFTIQTEEAELTLQITSDSTFVWMLKRNAESEVLPNRFSVYIYNIPFVSSQ